MRDVQVLSDFATDALCAVTAVTAQSNSQVFDVHQVPPEMIRAQIAAAFATRKVRAVKIGMLGTRAAIEALIESLPPRGSIPIVLDPVLAASSGAMLLDAGGFEAMREDLIPRATLVTPNVPEAAALLGEDLATSETELIAQAQRLLALGPEAVLLKGGHATGDEAVDWLVSRSHPVKRLAAQRFQVTRRGTGCALASAIAAGLAAGVPLSEACGRAKEYVATLLQETLRRGAPLGLGEVAQNLSRRTR